MAHSLTDEVFYTRLAEIDAQDDKEFRMTTIRQQVYQAVDSERAYQDAGAGNAQRTAADGECVARPLSPGEYILCMEKCLADARAAWYKPGGGTACLDYVRKVTALGVACMEHHGAPRREGF